MEHVDSKPLRWVGSSRKDLRAFPDPVQLDVGHALWLVQTGATPPESKPLKGIGGGVMELVESFDGDAYRAVYTVRFTEAVYVLHVFQKKSTKGIATPKQDIELIKARLKAAEEDYRAWQTRQKGEQS